MEQSKTIQTKYLKHIFHAKIFESKRWLQALCFISLLKDSWLLKKVVGQIL